MKSLQKEIVAFVERWDKARGTKSSRESQFFHLVEEVGELARQYVNRESRKEYYDEREVKNSIGDSIIQLVELAHLYGFDVEELLLEIMRNEEPRLRAEEEKRAAGERKGGL